MYFLLPLISILGLSLNFAKIYNTRFTFSLPIVTSILIGILTVGAGFNILLKLTGFIIFLGIIGFIYYIFKFFPLVKYNIIKFKGEWLIITLLSIIYCIYIGKSHLAWWDDLGFWGVFVKELKLYNMIYPSSGSLNSVLPTHIHYPRGPSLFYYFNSYFYTDCNDVTILRSQFFLHLIFLVPLMANRYWWQTIGLISLMLILPIQWLGLYTTGNDGLIGLIFSSVIIIYILENNKYKALYLIAPILLFMPLFREVGLWLALLAALIISVDLLINNNENFKINSQRIKLLMLFSLPIITHYIWFAYVEAHVPLGRPSHGLSLLKKLINEIVNTDGQKRAALFCAFESLKKGFTDKVYLIIYFITFITWMWIYSYAPQYRKSYNSFLIVSVICLFIYVVWRIYLYLSVLEAAPILWLTDITFRYIMSFTIIFIAVPCAYAKKILLEETNITEFNSVPNILSMLISGMAFIFVLQYLHNYIPILEKNFWAVSIRKNTKILTQLYSKGFNNIEYDYSYKSAKDGYDTKTRACYTPAYLLSPYYSNATRTSCLNFVQSNPDNIDSKKFNTMDSNIDNNIILQNPELYKHKCRIKFFITYNYLNIYCDK